MTAAASQRAGKYGVVMAASGRLPVTSITAWNHLATVPAACSGSQPASGRTLPAVAPIAPATIMNGTSGTTRRFDNGAISESRWTSASNSGHVIAWAARVAARASRKAPGSQASHLLSESAQITIPKVAANESWKPTSRTRLGLIPSSTAAASARATVTWLCRWIMPPKITSPPIRVARSAAGDAPERRA